MKYQWRQDLVKDGLILDVDKKVGGMLQEEYPKLFYVDTIATPSLVTALLKIEGIESVTVSTPYQLKFQVASLFDAEKIRDQIIQTVHRYLDTDGELVEVTSSDTSQKTESPMQHAIWWGLFHQIWGLSKDAAYDEQKWKYLQRRLESLEHDIKISTLPETLRDTYLR